MIKVIIRLFYILFGHHILDAAPETQWYQEPVDSLLSTEDHIEKTLNAGGWQCQCGRANLPYVSTCTCGMNKRGQRSCDLEAKQRHQALSEKELQEKMDHCRLMYTSHLMSQEEYETEIDRLMRFGHD